MFFLPDWERRHRYFLCYFQLPNVSQTEKSLCTPDRVYAGYLPLGWDCRPHCGRGPPFSDRKRLDSPPGRFARGETLQ